MQGITHALILAAVERFVAHEQNSPQPV